VKWAVISDRGPGRAILVFVPLAVFLWPRPRFSFGERMALALLLAELFRGGDGEYGGDAD
jgi:hypothetical protein